jgi:hypothetical protein
VFGGQGVNGCGEFAGTVDGLRGVPAGLRGAGLAGVRETGGVEVVPSLGCSGVVVEVVSTPGVAGCGLVVTGGGVPVVVDGGGEVSVGVVLVVGGGGCVVVGGGSVVVGGGSVVVGGGSVVVGGEAGRQ